MYNELIKVISEHRRDNVGAVEGLSRFGDDVIASPDSGLGLRWRSMGKTFLPLHNAMHGEIGGGMNSYSSNRDPAFYKVHGLVDILYEKYLQSLPKRNLRQYKNENSDISTVALLSSHLEIKDKRHETRLNVLYSTVSNKQVDVSCVENPFRLTVTAKEAEPFQYVHKLRNTDSREKRVMVRVFMTHDPSKSNHWFEMDKFAVAIPAYQVITVTRDAVDASVVAKSIHGTRSTKPNNLCPIGNLCGIPAHMYLPRGTKSGIRYTVLVAVSSFDKDIVPGKTVQDFNDSAKFNSLLCGAVKRGSGCMKHDFLDSKPMGYPLEASTFSSNIREVEMDSLFKAITVTIFESK